MNLIEQGRRLAVAREQLSITKNEAGEAAGLPATAVSRIEEGGREASFHELTTLSNLYCRPFGWFSLDEWNIEDDVALALGEIVSCPDATREIRVGVARCLRVCREAAFLEDVLGRSERLRCPIYRGPAPNSAEEASARGKQMAERERERLGLGNVPVANLTELLVKLGIRSATLDLPRSIPCLVVHHPNIGVAVLANAGDSPVNQRFHLARVYGRQLMECSVNHGGDDGMNELIDSCANAFAAEFLLPEDGLRTEMRLLGKGGSEALDRATLEDSLESRRTGTCARIINFPDVALIAHRFGAGYPKVVHRMKSIGCVNQTAADRLLSPRHEAGGEEYLRMLGMFEGYGAPVVGANGSRELRGHVAHLGMEAHRRQEISRGRLFEIGEFIGVAGSELVDLAVVPRDW